MDRLAVSRALEASDLATDVVFAGTIEEARTLLDSGPFDCALTDFGLPDGDGREVLRHVLERAIDVPVVMLTGRGDERLAVEMMQEGARDYIAKSHLSPARVSQSVRQAVALAENERLARRAREHRQLLARTTEVLLRSLDHRSTLAEVAHMLAEEYADACRIEIEPPHAGGEREVIAALRTGPDAASSGDDQVATTDSLAAAAERARTSGTVWNWPDSVDVGSADQESSPAADWATGLAAPFFIRTEAVGALVLAHSDALRRFDEFDESFVRIVADHLGTAIDNARLFEGQRRAVEARDEVLAVVSHDLRNPLNAVSAGTRLVLEVPLSEERRREQLDIVVQAADRMNHMIQDLLDVSQMEARTFAVRPMPVRPVDVVRRAVALSQAAFEDAGIGLSEEVPEDLPEILADIERLLRVFANLLGNASKFASQGSEVVVRAQALEGAVRFDVQDQGPGIPDDERDHLFDRFWQGRRKRRVGAGLGLAIARGITEAHGGTIWVESAEGEGSTFSFTIPTAPAPSTAGTA